MYQRCIKKYWEVTVTWKPIGRPVVLQQRDRWVVRIDGIDTASGVVRPRQLGTFRSKRAAQQATAASPEAVVTRRTPAAGT